MKFHVCVILFTVFEVFISGHSNVHCTQTLVGENSCLLMQATEERIFRSPEECRKPVERESWKSGRCRIRSRDSPRLLAQTVVGQKKVNPAIQVNGGHKTLPCRRNDKTKKSLNDHTEEQDPELRYDVRKCYGHCKALCAVYAL